MVQFLPVPFVSLRATGRCRCIADTGADQQSHPEPADVMPASASSVYGGGGGGGDDHPQSLGQTAVSAVADALRYFISLPAIYKGKLS